ncbi:hypothetical protein BKA61DRAFT_607225 [Leptodontidium sp. MPI-SDFR-AT-0119]|nr:hypothetical protein BKA61DRAFT_607225 [Leptodontidium sp. MPI-SDFR-AT-0119]
MRAHLLILILVSLIAADVLKNDEASEQQDTGRQRSALEPGGISNDAVRCYEDSLKPGFLPPKWDSRSSEASSDQKPLVDSVPDSEAQPTGILPPTASCDCKCNQAICCTNYLIKSLPSRGWFCGAGLLLFIYHLPSWLARWLHAVTPLVVWWRGGGFPVPESRGRQEKR